MQVVSQAVQGSRHDYHRVAGSRAGANRRVRFARDAPWSGEFGHGGGRMEGRLMASKRRKNNKVLTNY